MNFFCNFAVKSDDNMITKNEIKMIRSLEHKKYRVMFNCFVAEGTKTVGDMLGHFKCSRIVATKAWFDQNDDLPSDIKLNEVDNDTLRRISSLEHPQQVLALFEIPEYPEIPTPDSDNTIILALDGVQNPGNLGTIIRIADWFGIKDIVCSHGTVDVYNPKVVQAAMGSMARVRVHYTDLSNYLWIIDKEIPIYGTFLDGEDVYTSNINPAGVIIMGNEGQGISPEIASLVTQKLTIPNFNSGSDGADSLNVAVATAIMASEFRRR